MIYLCDCHKGEKLSKAKLGKGKMGLTDANEEGICLYCGHYAVCFNRIPENRNGSLRKNVTVDKILSGFYGYDAQEAIKKKVGHYLPLPITGAADTKGVTYDSGYANHLIEESELWSTAEYSSWEKTNNQ